MAATTSHDAAQRSRLQRRYLDTPARWTDDQPNFLRFSFPPSPTPAIQSEKPPSPSPSPPDLSKVRESLVSRDWGLRNRAIASLFSVLANTQMRSKSIALVYKRRRIPVGCVVLPGPERDGEETYFAYADERNIIYQKNLATDFHERKAVNRKRHDPYIAALLIAVAQARDGRKTSPHVTASVLFTPNPIDPNLSGRVEHIHLYSARIPRPLLSYLRRPTLILPAYDAVSVTCVSIPVEPVESLRKRTFLAMPDYARNCTHETGEE